MGRQQTDGGIVTVNCGSGEPPCRRVWLEVWVGTTSYLQQLVDGELVWTTERTNDVRLRRVEWSSYRGQPTKVGAWNEARPGFTLEGFLEFGPTKWNVHCVPRCGAVYTVTKDELIEAGLRAHALREKRFSLRELRTKAPAPGR